MGGGGCYAFPTRKPWKVFFQHLRSNSTPVTELGSERGIDARAVRAPALITLGPNRPEEPDGSDIYRPKCAKGMSLPQPGVGFRAAAQ